MVDAEQHAVDVLIGDGRTSQPGDVLEAPQVSFSRRWFDPGLSKNWPAAQCWVRSIVMVVDYLHEDLVQLKNALRCGLNRFTFLLFGSRIQGAIGENAF